MVTEAQVGAAGEPTLADAQRGADRGVRHRLRSPRPDLDLAVHRHGPAGRGLSRRPGAAGRRRRARAQPDRRPGSQHRRAGRGEPRMEARRGGQRDGAGEPARHLPRRAPSGRRARAAQHDGADRAPPPGRPHGGGARDGGRAPGHGRAAPAVRRDDDRPGHPLRPRRGAPAARAPHARPRPRHRRRPAAGLRPAARGPAGAPRTSGSPAGPTARRGPTGSGRSTPSTTVGGSFRTSGRSAHPRPC